MAWVIIVCGWIAGWFLLRRSREPNPAVRKGDTRGVEASGSPESVSVIVPARNEADNLRRLLPSLLAQTLHPAEIIVVDDDSEDDTAKVAAAFGVKVIQAGELPEGWFGKSWGSWRGASESTGKLLVFLDADLLLRPDALAWLVGRQARMGGLLSVQPYHWMERPYERLSAFFNVIVLASVGRNGAFGPCLVCPRDDYFAAGGHQAVRDRILENFELGAAFARQGFPVDNVAGGQAVRFRMYPDGLRALLAGWSKSFAAGASSTPRGKLLQIILWISGAFTAATQWIGAAAAGFPSADTAAVAIGYAAFVVQLIFLFRKAGSFGPMTALFYPLPLLVFIGVFLNSLIQSKGRNKVRWKGRTLTLGKDRDTR